MKAGDKSKIVIDGLAFALKKLRAETNQESVSGWNEKENRFVDSINIPEEEITNTKTENDKLLESQRAATEENAKTIRIARKETAQLKEMFSDKENYLQRLKQDHEGLKVSEAAATGSVRVLKRFLAATSTLDSSKVENESISDSIVSEAGKVVTKFSLERWSGRRHSIEEPGKLKGTLTGGCCEKKKQKRTIRRFGDMLRGKSFHKQNSSSAGLQ
uniref:Uncharacterized protein n=1 Tax=Musa acuminata subsp. malaccensis TaxID=214687 RepID=A0A804JV48_MUSAM